jgi:hypothetical protein
MAERPGLPGLGAHVRLADRVELEELVVLPDPDRSNILLSSHREMVRDLLSGGFVPGRLLPLVTLPLNLGATTTGKHQPNVYLTDLPAGRSASPCRWEPTGRVNRSGLCR